MKKIILLLFLSLVACSSHKKDAAEQALSKPVYMKSVSFDSYSSLWDKVKAFEKKGLTKSALDFVQNTIYPKAKKDNNTPQIVKSLLYIAKYSQRVKEDDLMKTIELFRKEIKESTPPLRNILQNYLTQIYWKYYQQNRHRFASNIAADYFDSQADFRTWDMAGLFGEINRLFDASLQDKDLLKQLPLSNYREIVAFDPKAEKYYPSLYDLLVNEALKFYKSEENSLPQPSYKFRLDNPEYLSDAQTFMDLKLAAKDSLSLLLKSLQLYQEWMKSHWQKKEEFDALANADLQRIYFVYSRAQFPGKDSLYLRVLHKFTEDYKASDRAALALYYLADYYFKNGEKYANANNIKHRYDLVKAVQYCDKALKNYPKTEGAYRSSQLKNTILSKNLSLSVESLFPENEKQLIKINFKNIKGFKITVFKVDYEEYWKRVLAYMNKKEIYDFIKKQKQIYTQNEKLPDTKDYQAHSTERVLRELPNGQYVLLVESKNSPSVFGYSFLQSTNIALQKLVKGDKYHFTVVDRRTGEKIKNYQLEISKRMRQNEYVPINHFVKEKDGSFSILPPARYEYLKIKVIYGKGKTAWFTDNINPFYRDINDEFIQEKAFVFTDRSIYRPGQIVYYKVLALKQRDNHSDLLTGKTLDIILKDANYKEISRQTLTTNDFGTAAGNFVLPQEVLTGNFHLEIRQKGLFSSKDFKVENYKRPKFEVKFSPVKETYKVNEKVKLKGEAVSYAGAPLSDAKVHYRVKRIVELPRWWFWYRPFYTGTPQEIAHGETKTGMDGQFEISFMALPDLSVSPQDQPVFTYEVTAEVTDINGETHVASTRIKAGYQSLKTKLDLPRVIFKEKNKDSLEIKLTNLNNVPVSREVSLKIFKLKAPSRVLRERPWPSPDLQEIDKKTFVSLFPHIPYKKEEADFHYWPQGKNYFIKKIKVKGQEKIKFPSAKYWPQGKYLAIATTYDKDGNKVEDKVYFDIYSLRNNEVPDHLFYNIHKDKAEYLPGEKMKLKVSSAVPNSLVRLILEKHHKIIYDRWVELDNTSKTFTVSVNEKDRGGFVVHYIFYAYNTWRKGSVYAKVPYPSKNLKLETLHFRDKLLPGKKETLSFLIKGPEGEKVAAEMLASMYDASLDAFVPNKWSFSPIRWRYYQPKYALSLGSSFSKNNIYLVYPFDGNYSPSLYIPSPGLKWFGFRLGFPYRHYMSVRGNPGIKHMPMDKKEVVETVAMDGVAHETKAVMSDQENTSDGILPAPTNSLQDEQEATTIRKNLQETAFFFPQLHTDKNGVIRFSFIVPDALTKWKLQLLSHDKKLNYAYNEMFAQTQKDLMIFPNMPRFVREGDLLSASVKITNLTDKTMSGFVQIFLSDALTQQNLSSQYVLGKSKLPFKISPKGSTNVTWKIQVKDNSEALQYKFIATAGNQSDGEQNVLPVLSNRMLVTETMPMWVRPKQEKEFVLEKLKNSHSKTLQNHLLSLEVTSNPAWYAIQSLPYLMERQRENSEQIFSRYYANALAENIIKKHPQIKRVFDHWKSSGALLSALEKNPELKAIVLDATPWVRDAENETEQKKRIALLFDYNKMSYELAHSLDQLRQLQKPSGGFVWYKGSPRADRYITQYIVNGLGHLKKLGIDISSAHSLLSKAIRYTDNQLIKDYEKLLKEAELSKNKEKYLRDYRPGYVILYSLYGRSFFPEIEKSKEYKKVYAYYLNQAQKYWTAYDYYSQALLALTSFRANNVQLAKDIITSLNENSVDSPELGKYWKMRYAGWRFFQSDIEVQAQLIEAFQEIGENPQVIDEMRIWLLKHKQTHAWKNSKQTAEAIYAFLNSGTSWLPISHNVKLKIGKKWIEPEKMPEVKVEAGTGYFKKTWRKKEIKPEMAEVKIINKGKGIVWGALYWQYFEDLNKITQAKTQLAVNKKLYIRKITDRGEELVPVTKHTPIKVGDLVRVRITIKVDRDMEYVHLKDMRASGMEPVDVLSGYKWKNGLGFYQSVNDVSTNFFFSRLPKGVYVFEHDLRANNAGVFSGGIAHLQSMYAPEFSSHSQGESVEIKK